MKNIFVLSLLFVSSLAHSASFPRSPDPKLTPGDLCTQGRIYRYDEKIRYCERNVDSGEKRQIIRAYDQQLGYSIERMPRVAFKIDHYIPLCMGGSNDAENLWPQHESVYVVTDPLESIACDKMAKGVLTQARAIEYIKRAKANIDEAPAVISIVEKL